MGKKQLWNRNYSEKYLVDRAFNQLSFAEHGLLKIINDLLWTQTDEPGKYIIKGQPGTWNDLISDAKRYAHGSMRDSRRTTDRQLTNILAANGLADDEQQVIYSPFILNELKISEMRQKAGEMGGNPSLSRGLSKNKILDKPRYRVEKNIYNTNGNKLESKNYSNSVAHGMKNYLTEAIGKLGRGELEPGTAFKLSKHLPHPLLTQAYGATQDAQMNSLDPDMDLDVKNYPAYFVDQVKKLCTQNGHPWPLGNGPEQPPEPDLDDLLDQTPPEKAKAGP